MKKEDTPSRIAKRLYENKNRELRKQKSGTFSTYIPRTELNEINEFLKKHNLTKVELIRRGYEALKGSLENNS